MGIQATTLRCPNCGANVSQNQENCEYCCSPLFFTSFNSISDFSPLQLNKYESGYRKELANDPNNTALNTSIAFCYLQLKMYDEAYNAFSKAIVDNFDNSEVYFYAAVSLLKGKKAFLHTRPEIDKILELINAAIMIESRGIYHYFMAYIKYDYFKRKFLNTTPTYKDCLMKAQMFGCSKGDIDHFYSVAGVDPISIV
jgi:tetratricopeptide (TPR) repeat protein